MSKQQENARFAAAKAAQPVFISGLFGQHTLETGVAYYYRGHYVYACPAGMPIQPIPFVIKKGINIIGISANLAPRYNAGASDLVSESSISALKKACDSFNKECKEEEERNKREVVEALEHERLLQVPGQLTATRRAPSVSSLTSSLFHTPHDRARFLSDSAPGSRIASVTNTPYASRPVSPTHIGLRQVSSTTRLFGLNDNHASHLSNVAEGSSALSLYVQEDDFNSSTEDMYMPSAAAIPIASPPYSRNKPIGTGRPRKASFALNQAYNAKKEVVPMIEMPQITVQDEQQENGKSRVCKCVLHGEGCDGKYVAHTWRTQHASKTTGFRELVPFVQGEGSRIIVDWEKVLLEEKAKLGGRGGDAGGCGGLGTLEVPGHRQWKRH